MMMRALHTRLKALFPLGELTEQRPNLSFVTLPASHLRPTLLHLRDREGFTHLVLLTAVDWLEDGQFQLTYLLSNRTQRCDIGLRVMIGREDATMETTFPSPPPTPLPEGEGNAVNRCTTSMESIHDIWPTAATYQRELREMFGIEFPGSPRLHEDFILEGWHDIPPYRRDFDTLKYAEENYRPRPGRETHDPAMHMKQQLYPDGR